MSFALKQKTFNNANSFQILTDEQWSAIQSLFPNPLKRSRGKPHCAWRYVMNSILLVLHTGGKWKTLEKSPNFASKSATHRWFVLWEKNGLLTKILDTLCVQSHDPLSFPRRRERMPAQSKKVTVNTHKTFNDLFPRDLK